VRALAKSATDRGLFVTLASSGPHSKIVAPYGGKQPLFSPNPFAIGSPASRHPVLVDICASITSVSMTREKVAAGTLFEHPWLMDSEGRPTRCADALGRRRLSAIDRSGGVRGKGELHRADGFPGRGVPRQPAARCRPPSAVITGRAALQIRQCPLAQDARVHAEPLRAFHKRGDRARRERDALDTGLFDVARCLTVG
jgi:Malate/L-lactate dehydrogenase